MTDRLLTTAELCEKLSVSRQAIVLWRKEGMPIAVDRPNGIKRYDLEMVIEWLNNKKI